VKKEEGNERERKRENGEKERKTIEKVEGEKLSQVSVVRETSTEIAEVVPIFANAVFGEMQILFDGWTSLDTYENEKKRELQMRD